MLTTFEPSQLPYKGLGEALERLLRPAVGFDHPADVLKDPLLDARQKRAILSSWASDASAVEDQPKLRWLLGSPHPVPLARRAGGAPPAGRPRAGRNEPGTMEKGDMKTTRLGAGLVLGLMLALGAGAPARAAAPQPAASTTTGAGPNAGNAVTARPAAASPTAQSPSQSSTGAQAAPRYDGVRYAAWRPAPGPYYAYPPPAVAYGPAWWWRRPWGWAYGPYPHWVYGPYWRPAPAYWWW